MTAASIDLGITGWHCQAMRTAKRSALATTSSLQIKRTLLDCVEGGARILMTYFGRVTNPRQKENPSSIVCDADLASERFILQRIRTEFPQDHIVSEESGYRRGSSDFTWVVDPLDGTSNFLGHCSSRSNVP